MAQRGPQRALVRGYDRHAEFALEQVDLVHRQQVGATDEYRVAAFRDRGMGEHQLGYLFRRNFCDVARIQAVKRLARHDLAAAVLEESDFMRVHVVDIRGDKKYAAHAQRLERHDDRARSRAGGNAGVARDLLRMLILAPGAVDKAAARAAENNDFRRGPCHGEIARCLFHRRDHHGERFLGDLGSRPRQTIVADGYARGQILGKFAFHRDIPRRREHADASYIVVHDDGLNRA